MNEPAPTTCQATRMDYDTWRYIRELWTEMRTELDRSLLLASSAGIGFCTTMLFDKSLMDSRCLMWSLFFALTAFSVSAAAMLLVFKFNANYLHRLMYDPNASNKDRLLAVLDWVGVGAFIVAVLAIFFAICIRLFV